MDIYSTVDIPHLDYLRPLWNKLFTYFPFKEGWINRGADGFGAIGRSADCSRRYRKEAKSYPIRSQW